MPMEKQITIDAYSQALLFAAEQNNTIAIISLLARGADRSIKNQNNKTPIEIVAEKQNFAALFAFAKYKTDVVDSNHYSQALVVAIRHNQFNLAFALLLANASPNARQQFKSDKRGEEGDTCLHIAVRNKNPHFIQLLYRFGADFSVKNTKEALIPFLLGANLGFWKTPIPAFIDIDDFEEARGALMVALSAYSDYCVNGRVKKQLIAACHTEVFSVKELIALLELYINLFDPLYCSRHFNILTQQQKQSLPPYAQPIHHRKDKFYSIIKNFHQALMEKLLQENKAKYPAENIDLFFSQQKTAAPPPFNPSFDCDPCQIKQ